MSVPEPAISFSSKSLFPQGFFPLLLVQNWGCHRKYPYATLKKPYFLANSIQTALHKYFMPWSTQSERKKKEKERGGQRWVLKSLTGSSKWCGMPSVHSLQSCGSDVGLCLTTSDSWTHMEKFPFSFGSNWSLKHNKPMCLEN